MGVNAILCYGDSNTYGYDPRDPFGGRYGADSRWCYLLAQQLGVPVINQGENGRTIPRDRQALQRLLDAIVREAPRMVLILLGTNDILTGCGTPAEIAQRMDSFLRQLRRSSPELPILLISPPPIALPEFLGAAEELAALYGSVARENRCAFLDSCRWVLPLAFDGVHLSEEGHRLFAQHLYKTLVPML